MLETTWFVLWGLLWAVYFVLDGFDFGMGTLLPFLAKNDEEKRIIYNAAGPYWDGNEVWLITAGGVTFAAFPKAYAVMFSALYAPLLILLFALIFRAVSFEFRNKKDCPQWRKFWDACQFLGNFLPALLLGVAFANLFMGIPIDGNGVYHGNIIKLLNPYGLAGGIFFVLIFCMHGALWLALKSEGDIHERAVGAAQVVWPLGPRRGPAFPRPDRVLHQSVRQLRRASHAARLPDPRSGFPAHRPGDDLGRQPCSARGSSARCSSLP